jgi:hypothetical protein
MFSTGLEPLKAVNFDLNTSSIRSNRDKPSSGKHLVCPPRTCCTADWERRTPKMRERCRWEIRCGLRGPPEDSRSIPSGHKQEAEAGSAGESPEIPIARKERNATIDTTLGDQGIAEARLAALRQHLCS